MKILIAPLLILLALMAIGSAAATPQTATPITATTTGTGAFTGITLNDGGIFFYDGTQTGTAKLYITSTTTPDYTLTTNLAFNGTINTKTDNGMIHYQMTWSYIVNDEVLGTFQGPAKADTTTYLYNPANGYPRAAFSTNSLHTVLQGTGIFHGQTLKIDGIRPAVDPSMPPTTPSNPTTWTGILLTH
jgi:hypothetical protein